jgi:hypothetical protein
MSAKLTILFFILICLEIGALLIVLPWISFPPWNENYLVVTFERSNWHWLASFIKSGYVRGAVTGLGFLNITLGIWEIVNFKKTARAFQIEWQSEQLPGGSIAAAGVPDNRPDAAGEPESTARTE